MIAKEKGRDPLPRIEAFVIEEGVVVQEEMEALKRTLCERIEEAARLADALPFPDPSTAAARLFCQSEEVVESPEEERLSFSSEGIVMVDALNRALHEEMALDERVVVFGQDVGDDARDAFLARDVDQPLQQLRTQALVLVRVGDGLCLPRPDAR